MYRNGSQGTSGLDLDGMVPETNVMAVLDGQCTERYVEACYGSQGAERKVL